MPLASPHQTTLQRSLFSMRSHATQSMSVTKNEAPVFSAEELLTIDEGQLVRYMEHSALDGGGFDISSASGFERLSGPQREELTERLK